MYDHLVYITLTINLVILLQGSYSGRMDYNYEQLMAFGKRFGESLRGGETLELIGDVGAGKTTFVKALATGMGISDDVQSPSFTISREYDAPSGIHLAHYDFYRLSDPGVMSYELAESLEDPNTVTVVEWADTVQSVLPEDRITINFNYVENENLRQIVVSASDRFAYLKEIEG